MFVSRTAVSPVGAGRLTARTGSTVRVSQNLKMNVDSPPCRTSPWANYEVAPPAEFLFLFLFFFYPSSRFWEVDGVGMCVLQGQHHVPFFPFPLQLLSADATHFTECLVNSERRHCVTEKLQNMTWLGPSFFEHAAKGEAGSRAGVASCNGAQSSNSPEHDHVDGDCRARLRAIRTRDLRWVQCLKRCPSGISSGPQAGSVFSCDIFMVRSDLLKIQLVS